MGLMIRVMVMFMRGDRVDGGGEGNGYVYLLLSEEK